jgi:carbon monoxide dehydrogenase subunit G
MVVVDTKYEGAVDVSASAEVAFALVSDVGRSGAHFPAVDRLDPVDEDGRWRWKIKEKGIGPVRMRAVYDAVYVSDAEAMTVEWKPPRQGAGDMESYGSWRVERQEEGARLHFSARTVVRVPAPGIMRRMVEAFAKEETIKLKKEYLKRIVATLNAG